jgi:hypothetical protein
MKHNFNAVAIQIKHGSIEALVFSLTSSRRPMRLPSSLQRIRIELAHSSAAGCGERNMSRSSFYTRRLLREEEVRIANPEPDLITPLPQKPVPERLQCRKKE